MRYSPRILIVDDETESALALKEQILEISTSFRHDVKAITANSGIEALAIIKEKGVDVLLIDYHLAGGMFGDEIVDYLNDPLGTIMTVLVSGRQERELEGPVVRRQRQLGRRFRYLAKPVATLALKSLYLDIEAFLSERLLPYPVASAMKAFESTSTNQGRITAVKDLLETVIKYCTGILVADAVRRGHSPLSSVKLNWSLGLTFGAWLQWFRGLLDQPPDGTEFVPEIRQFFLDPLKNGETPLKFVSDFKEMRDQMLGHGHLQEEAFYGSAFEHVSLAFEEIVHRLAFLARYPLVLVESMHLDEKSPAFKYRMRALMGSTLPPPLINLSSVDRLYGDRVYLGNSLGDYLLLDPFIIFCLCEPCNLRRVFVLDGFDGQKIVYNAACDHRRTTSKGYVDFRQLVGAPVGK